MSQHSASANVLHTWTHLIYFTGDDASLSRCNLLSNNFATFYHPDTNIALLNQTCIMRPNHKHFHSVLHFAPAAAASSSSKSHYKLSLISSSRFFSVFISECIHGCTSAFRLFLSADAAPAPEMVQMMIIPPASSNRAMRRKREWRTRDG